MKKQTAVKVAALAAAGCAAWNVIRRRSAIDLHGKIVLVTGGSRGLGLQLAREFGARGAAVAICARDSEALERAHADLTSRGVKAFSSVCDVADRAQVETMIGRVAGEFGPIDVLVNNAGLIRVAPLAEMTLRDFEQAMGTMFWGIVYCTQAVLPSMRQRRQGSIVNVTSIGGKVSVPHLLPYCCAKFAAVGLSEGLHAELAPAGIHVTTIVPGLMRTGSHLHAEFKGKQKQEYAWFASGAATPLVSIGAERAARSIVDATVRKEAGRILSLPADVAARLHDLSPEFTATVLKMVNRLLPAAASQGQDQPVTGSQAEQSMQSSLWSAATSAGQAAAGSFNQLP